MASDNFNWYGDIQCFEGEPARPRSESELVQIVRDIGRFPSPIRPMGSRHSVTPCMAARAASGERWGTAVDMRAFRGPMRVDREAATVTVLAGMTFLEAARELRDKHGMQFRVNTELGTLTMGAAACGGTKDSSFPGEFGQVCADVVAVRLVTPDGEVRILKTGDPDFDAVLGGYGLFGIATEITFRIVPHEFISMEHVEISAAEFEAHGKQWLDGRTAVFLYLFPYAPGGGRIVAELRRKAGQGPTEGTHRLAVRNLFWREALPEAAHIADRLPIKPLRPHYLEAVQFVVRKFLDHALDLDRVSPVDQIVDFEKGGKKFGFSMWAFPAESFAQVLSGYFEFCRRQDYRTRLPHVSYHVAQDRHSLLSYSQDSDVWTLDPVSTGIEAGWNDFLRRFNDFCSDRDGAPLFNQTPHLERRHVVRAFGERLDRFESARRRFDPKDRMLNEYFAKLLRS
ncbi:MAG TPA: FAD-binding oxidoreductase [Burkholderiales bacterium]